MEDEDDNLPIMTGGGKEDAAGSSSNTSFVEYITSFSGKEKSQLLNLIQYGGLSIVPLLITLKLMKMYIPDEDPFKPTTEILFEVVIQVVIMISALFLIHKIIVYFPTYSNLDYDNISLLSGILPLFFLMFTLDTKFSNKLNTLFDRLLIALGVIKEPYSESSEEETNSNHHNHPPPNLSQPVPDGLDRMNQGSNSTRDKQMPSGSSSNVSQENFGLMDEGPQGYQF